MISFNKKFVTDAENQVVAVLIDREDWEKIEQRLKEKEIVEAQPEGKLPELEVKFTLQVRDIPEAIQQEAFRKAKEAYVMELLRHGDISTGRAAELIGMPRVELFDLMGKYDISIFPDYTPEELQREVNDALRMLEEHKK